MVRRIWKVCGEEEKEWRDCRRVGRERMSPEVRGGVGMAVAWLQGVR